MLNIEFLEIFIAPFLYLQTLQTLPLLQCPRQPCPPNGAHSSKYAMMVFFTPLGSKVLICGSEVQQTFEPLLLYQHEASSSAGERSSFAAVKPAAMQILMPAVNLNLAQF